ncbi:MAG TPA: preprotein translocase subunit YajC [Gammaproteobacteria bacterium]|nr:preprotein translocase subunit YajC [Gammaproteobacteria bacterium]
MKKIILSTLTLVGFVPVVLADAAAPAKGAHGSAISSMIMFGAIFIMMYFLMIRPQSKRAKELRNMLSTLAKDDEVVTQGGLLGKIVRDAGSFFIITLSEGVEVPVQKQSIVQVLPKGTLKTIC